MRRMRCISIFFVYTLFVLLTGCLLGMQLDYGIGYEEPVSENYRQKPNQAVLAQQETLCVDTECVVLEKDASGGEPVETVWKLPDKYIGMNREQFLESMELYASFPPLSERERGFAGLQVNSFSRQRVVVEKTYQFLQPSEGFYIAVYNNKLRVYLKDRETVFIDTDIDADRLDDQVKQEISGMLYLDTEEALYDFLEAYSS